MTKAAAKNKPLEDVVEIFDAEDMPQGSEEWLRIRIGICTASNFSTIMANGKDGGESVGRRKLLYQMAGEVLTSEPAETFKNLAMQRGNEMEDEACEYYAQRKFCEPQKVGFVKRTISNRLGSTFVVGCSPDRLINDDGVLETKTMRPDLIIELALKGAAGFPSEHRQQCQGSLWVTGRKWVDLQIFYRAMPIAPCFRIERDDAHIAKIAAEVERFDWDLRQLVEQIRKFSK